MDFTDDNHATPLDCWSEYQQIRQAENMTNGGPRIIAALKERENVKNARRWARLIREGDPYFDLLSMVENQDTSGAILAATYLSSYKEFSTQVISFCAYVLKEVLKSKRLREFEVVMCEVLDTMASYDEDAASELPQVVECLLAEDLPDSVERAALRWVNKVAPTAFRQMAEESRDPSISGLLKKVTGTGGSRVPGC